MSGNPFPDPALTVVANACGVGTAQGERHILALLALLAILTLMMGWISPGSQRICIRFNSGSTSSGWFTFKQTDLIY